MATNKKPLCFVIMPFSEKRKEVYYNAIKPACDEAGFRAVRLDEVTGVYNINRKIIEYLFKSEVVIADLTDQNANVFYEMGVAHAIDNKTIMIVQSSEKLPFDIRNYRCIVYEQSKTGLGLLHGHLMTFLNQLEQWRKRPSNPVQDFKPFEAFVLHKDVQKLQEKLGEQGKELQAVQREIKKKEKEVAAERKLREQEAEEKKALEQEVKKLREKIRPARSAPKEASRKTIVTPAFKFRSQGQEMSGEDVKSMLSQNGFFDSSWNEDGRGIVNEFEAVTHEGQKLIDDKVCGLTWQQGGSEEALNYKGAQGYIKELNAKKYGSYSNWRLPTLEEAMSLVKPGKNKDGLFLDPVFDKAQQWIWTADKKSSSAAWSVSFYNGYCYFYRVDSSVYVRAVR